MIRLVAERVAEHLAYAGEFVLAVEREDHPEQAVELSAFHALTEKEDIFCDRKLVFQKREIHIPSECAAIADDKIRFVFDRLHIFKHGFAFVRIDAK